MAVIAPPVKPRTLTRDQFVQTPTARRGGTYDRYLTYLAAHRKPAVARRRPRRRPLRRIRWRRSGPRPTSPARRRGR
jgi:hypothetical protein